MSTVSPQNAAIESDKYCPASHKTQPIRYIGIFPQHRWVKSSNRKALCRFLYYTHCIKIVVLLAFRLVFVKMSVFQTALIIQINQIQRSFSSASYNPPCLAYLDAQKNRSAFRKPVLTSCSCLLRRTFCLLTCDSRFAGRAFFRILAARFVKRAICAVQHCQCFAAILLCIVRKAIRFFFIHSDHILRSRFRPASANRFMAYTAGASTPP